MSGFLARFIDAYREEIKAAPKPYRVQHGQQGKGSCEVMKISCGASLSFLKLNKWSNLAMKPESLCLLLGRVFIFTVLSTRLMLCKQTRAHERTVSCSKGSVYQ